MSLIGSGIWHYIFDPIGAVAIMTAVALNLRYPKLVVLNTILFSAFLLIRDYVPIPYWGGQSFTPFYFAITLLIWLPIGAIIVAWIHRYYNTELPAEYNMVFFFYTGLALFFRLKGLLVPYLWKYGKKLGSWEPRQYYYGSHTKKNYEDLWQKKKPLYLIWRYQKRAFGVISDRFDNVSYDLAQNHREELSTRKTSLSGYSNQDRPSHLKYLSQDNLWHRFIRWLSFGEKLPHGLENHPNISSRAIIYSSEDIIKDIEETHAATSSFWDALKFSDQMKTDTSSAETINNNFKETDTSSADTINNDFVEPEDILTPNEFAKFKALKEDGHFDYREPMPVTFKYMSLEEKKNFLLNKKYHDHRFSDSGCLTVFGKGALALFVVIVLLIILKM